VRACERDRSLPVARIFSWSRVGASSSASRSVEPDGDGGGRGGGAITKSYPRPDRWRVTTRDREWIGVSVEAVCICMCCVVAGPDEGMAEGEAERGSAAVTGLGRSCRACGRMSVLLVAIRARWSDLFPQVIFPKFKIVTSFTYPLESNAVHRSTL
jgi:hypothetical protein